MSDDNPTCRRCGRQIQLEIPPGDWAAEIFRRLRSCVSICAKCEPPETISPAVPRCTRGCLNED
jgi:hypothetical protein